MIPTRRPVLSLGQPPMLSDGGLLLRLSARPSPFGGPARGASWRRVLLCRVAGLVALALPYAAWADLPVDWLPFAAPVGVIAD